MNLWDLVDKYLGRKEAPPAVYVPPARRIDAPTLATAESAEDVRFQRMTEGFILKWECDWPEDKSGQYSNDPSDSGGPTKWGIDLTGQKVHDPSGDWDAVKIKALSIDDALVIYKRDYWTRHECGALQFPLGELAYNSWINGGKPTQWLKECGGVPSKYIDLMEDYYRDLAERKPKNRKFLKGWLNRSEDLKTYLSIS